MEQLFPLESSWIVAVFAGTVAIFMLLQLARSLPGQNIAFIAVVLLTSGALLQWWLAKYTRMEVIGPMWCFLAGGALLWLAVVLSARRLAQFILRPWRRADYYGIWLLAMSAVATAAFQFGWPCLDFDPEMGPVDLSKAAIMAGIRGGATLILLAVLSPWFIRKRPRKSRSQLAQQPEKQAEQDAGEQARR